MSDSVSVFNTFAREPISHDMESTSNDEDYAVCSAHGEDDEGNVSIDSNPLGECGVHSKGGGGHSRGEGGASKAATSTTTMVPAPRQQLSLEVDSANNTAVSSPVPHDHHHQKERVAAIGEQQQQRRYSIGDMVSHNHQHHHIHPHHQHEYRVDDDEPLVPYSEPHHTHPTRTVECPECGHSHVVHLKQEQQRYLDGGSEDGMTPGPTNSAHTSAQASTDKSEASSDDEDENEEGTGGAAGDNNNSLSSRRNSRKGGNYCCGIRWSFYEGADMTVCGVQLTLDVVLYFLGAIFVCIVWLGLWTALPTDLSEPAGEILGPISTIIVCTFAGQYIVSRNLELPPAIGIFICSIIWNHIYQVGFMSRGTFALLRFLVGKVGLATILIRSGLALNWNTIKPRIVRVSSLALIPFAVESVVTAAMAFVMFHEEYRHNWKWCFLHGFMAAVIASGLIVPEMLGLMGKGFTKGVPPLAISAVSFDTALGVWSIGFMLQMLFSDMDIGLLAALGPIQLIGGAILGFVVSFLFCALMRLLRRNMWRNPTAMRRFAMFYFLAVALGAVFFGQKYELSGGGTIMALTFATGVGHILDYEVKCEDRELKEKWERRVEVRRNKINGVSCSKQQQQSDAVAEQKEDEKELVVVVHPVSTPQAEDEISTTAANTASTPTTVNSPRAYHATVPASNITVAAVPIPFDEMSVPFPPRHHRVAAEQRLNLIIDLRDFWDFIVAGPLFSLAGALVNIPKLVSVAFLPKGLLVYAVGNIARAAAVSSTVIFGMGLNWKEIVFLPMAWIGKGAVQAATGGIALDNAVSALLALPANATAAERASAEADVEAGQVLLNTAALVILLSAPACSILITKVGPKMLQKTIE